MATSIATIEPLMLPDLRRPERMPSLPAWVASRASALDMNLQPDASGTFRDVVTLPPDRMLGQAQREEVESHLGNLRSLLTRTPEADQNAEAETLVLVTKMLLVLPSQRTSETGAEAKGEAYMEALDDVPSWAVRAGLRNWYRGDCGTDERGKPYDCAWAPPPATLRRVALATVTPVRARTIELQRLLNAVERVDCSAELHRGNAAWLGLRLAIAQKRDIASLTFDQAVDLANAEPTREAAE